MKRNKSNTYIYTLITNNQYDTGNLINPVTQTFKREHGLQSEEL